MCAPLWTVLGQIDHSVERLLLEENLADRYGIEIAALSETRFAEIGRSKKLVLAIHSFGVDVKLRRGVKQE